MANPEFIQATDASRETCRVNIASIVSVYDQGTSYRLVTSPEHYTYFWVEKGTAGAKVVEKYFIN